jgi:hypothetical protein
MTIHDEVTKAEQHYRRVVQLVYSNLRRDGWARSAALAWLDRWEVPEAVQQGLHDSLHAIDDLEGAVRHANSAFWDAQARAHEDA